MSNKCLVGLVRNEHNRIKRISSSNTSFRSQRNIDWKGMPVFFTGWISDRVIQEVPLYVSGEQILEIIVSNDYEYLPTSLKEVLDKGLLRTSGVKRTNYSVLMSVSQSEDSKPCEGRTGVLLHNHKPVVVKLDGKNFLVEIKGVGCPDGVNGRCLKMHRYDYFGDSSENYGSFAFNEALREYKILEVQRKRSLESFVGGESVRAVALFEFVYQAKKNDGEKVKSKNGYLIRFTPSNIRSSYNSNPAFSKHDELKLARDIGKQWALLAKIPECLLHTNIHPENIVWTGNSYVLTDFADCRKLRDFDDPYDFLTQALQKIREVPGLTKVGETGFYNIIAEELGVEWNKRKDYSGFIECVWSGFFASKVYKLRRGKYDRAQREIKAFKEKLRDNNKRKPLSFIFIEGARKFLEKEINLLKHIDDEIAQDSLDVARKRLSYIMTQLKNSSDINKKFKQDPSNYYDLYLLPYMN